jgi:hypothetical protein
MGAALKRRSGGTEEVYRGRRLRRLCEVREVTRGTLAFVRQRTGARDRRSSEFRQT